MVLLLFAFTGTRVPALDWPTTAVEFRPNESQKEVVAAFPFKNTGSVPVQIISIVPSCDCLSIKLAKETIAPGEAGEMRVGFALDGRSGRQERTIMVTSDDAPDLPTMLRLSVELPEPVAISPKFLYWRIGELAEEKAITITVSDSAKLKLGDVMCPEASFTVRLEPGNGGGRYRVLIQPASTVGPAQTSIRLHATIDGEPRVYVLNAAVN